MSQTAGVKHLLLTNDFPPKLGGIQSYLWELWRRLPPEDVTVYTSAYKGSEEFDKAQAYRVVRSTSWWLLPTKNLISEVNALADEVGAELIVIDPGLPLGLCGPRLNRPYVVVAHGAEFEIPAKLPVVGKMLRRTVAASRGILASGEHVSNVARRWPEVRVKPVISIPPGVDVERFTPSSDDVRKQTRKRLGLPIDQQLVVAMSRLVRRKGFDRVIRAVSQMDDQPVLAIAGRGRDGKRLEKLAKNLNVPVRFLGRVSDEDMPLLLGTADVFVMACHDRWFGLEKEGFGIVFVEAAACGVAAVAGSSGGSSEAVEDEVTGVIVHAPVTGDRTSVALANVLRDPERARAMGTAGRARAEAEFSYDILVQRLKDALVTFATR